MGFFSKMRSPGDRPSPPLARVPTRSGGPAPAMSQNSVSHTRHSGGDVRTSNGLREFLWNLEGLGNGSLLDLGPVWQNTITFFVERGFKVYADDLLRDWKEFLAVEEQRLRAILPGQDASEMTPESRAERFLKSNVQYPRGNFDAMLIWDLLDYLDRPLVKRLVEHLTDLLRPGGVVLGMFHNRKPEAFHRYRVFDAQHLELVPAQPLFPVQQTLQNREIQDLFRPFRTTKSFVGRDQLREVLFVK
jgi:hypothetical protein